MNMFELINNSYTIDECVEKISEIQKRGFFCNICPAGNSFCESENCPTCREALTAWFLFEVEE